MKTAHWISLMGLALLLSLASELTPQHFEFQDLDEAATKAEASGFFVASDRADGVIQNGFVVSPHPITYVDANHLLKTGKMGPAWKDKVWVTTTSGNFSLESISEDVAVHSWGNVIGFGDPQLLKVVQAKFQSSSVLN